MYKFSYFEECFVILNTNVVCIILKSWPAMLRRLIVRWD